jgi:serine phosphatase RsbU (regulator of sigma subunit)
MYGTERVEAVLSGEAGRGAAPVLRRLVADFTTFRRGRPASDDVTAIVAEVL